MYSFGKVSYINSLPLFAAEVPDFIKIEEGVPSKMNFAVSQQGFDAALISRWTYTAAVAKNYKILPRFCIGGNGEIMSVKLFSKYPIEQLSDKKIFITDESGTSIRAFAFICEKKYHFDFFKNRTADIKTADAVFLIGDAALAFDSSSFLYLYDLGAMWKDFVGIPFIYAAVVVKRECFDKLSPILEKYFDASLFEFSTAPEKTFKRAKTIFAKSTGCDIQDAKLLSYYSKLIYKFDAKIFADSLKFVDENGNI